MRSARLVRPVLLVLLVSTSVTSCAAYMKMFPPKPPKITDNPLTSGQPLEATTKGDVGGVAEADCSIWPFEDKLTVAVTAAQICVEMHKNMAAPSGWSGEPTDSNSENVSVANDAGEGGSILASKSHAGKVGSCFNKGFNAQTAIWAVDYKGCAPNNGTITEATKSLTVGHESWTFPAGAPAGSGAAPATASR